MIGVLAERIDTGSLPRTGDDLARVFEAHYKPLYRAAYRVIGNATDAEDVLQSVFLRLARGDLDVDAADLGRYLHRSAINAALDLCRSRWRSGRVTLVDDRHPRQSETPHAAEAADLRAWLRRALTTLSPRQAEMFVMRYLEGYDNQEIARLLDTSRAVVAVSLHRARTRLQREFRRLAGTS